MFSDVLLLPLALPLLNLAPAGWLPGLQGYLPFAVNSVVWSVGAYFALKWAISQLWSREVTWRKTSSRGARDRGSAS